MLKPNEIEAYSMLFDKKLHEAENKILETIVKRIKANREITSSTDWQIKRLLEFGYLRKDIDKILISELNISEEELYQMYSDIAKQNYVYDVDIYDIIGVEPIPFEQNFILQQTVEAIAKQTNKEIQNFTQSLGFVTKQNGITKHKELTKYYQDILDRTVTEITTGATDYNTAIKQACVEMANSGIRTINYDSGYSSRIDVATRRAVMTGITQVTAKVNDINAELLDTDYFEVEFHLGARPSHQPWQGRVWSREQLVTICGLGEVTGLCGVNCYHTYYPFIKGISKRTYTDEQLEEMQKKENEQKEYKGKLYTSYEALQKQRQIETKLRAYRQRINLLKTGNASEKDIQAERSKYRILNAEYKAFSVKMGLPEQRQRILIDGLGRL